ncbi:hypothetical protein H311_00984, partial [Anncaliia algerae PRA109]
QTKEFKIIKMANRNMKTLGNLIEVDYPSKFRSIFRLFCFLLSYFRNNLKFKHFTVFDSHNFVDLETGTHTQNIESLWSKFKQFRRSKGYNKRKYLDFYVSEFEMRKKHKDILSLFIILIKLCFS